MSSLLPEQQQQEQEPSDDSADVDGIAKDPSPNINNNSNDNNSEANNSAIAHHHHLEHSNNELSQTTTATATSTTDAVASTLETDNLRNDEKSLLLTNNSESNTANGHNQHFEQQQHQQQHQSHQQQQHDDMAFAAHAAAQAMSESDAAAIIATEEPPEDDDDEEDEEEVDEELDEDAEEEELEEDESATATNTASAVVCSICGRGDDDGRPLLRFLPVEHDIAAATASPSVHSFTQDICLHIFCGKTASILPMVNQPELEILTKAGLKNKHGIGPEVNAALARTRCAILAQEGAKEKHFFLVREFEAHLAAVRQTRITYLPGSMQQQPQGADPTSQDYGVPDPYGETMDPTQHSMMAHSQQQGQQQQLSPATNPYAKVYPPRAPTAALTHRQQVAAGVVGDGGTKRSHDSMLSQQHQQQQIPLPMGEPTKNGRVRCGCGGIHLPTDTPRGISSWRSHIATKRHQKWMATNGVLGAV